MGQKTINPPSSKLRLEVELAVGDVTSLTFNLRGTYLVPVLWKHAFPQAVDLQ